MQVLIAFLYLLIISISFWGYGSLVLDFRRQKIESSLSTPMAVGISIFILLFGFFEFFHKSSRLALVMFLVVGLIFSLSKMAKNYYQWASNRNINSDKIRLKLHNPKLLMSVSLCIFACIFFAYSIIHYFYHLPLNQHDDFSGYLVLSQRILQEGYQGADPFNDRSIEQGFGAGNYLIALLISVLPIAASHLADAGLGIFLLFLLIIDAFKKSSKSIYLLLTWILLLYAVVLNAPIVNTSPLIIACGIFIVAINFFIHSSYGANYGDHILIALLLSTFLALKGNYIVPVCALSICIYLSRMQIVGLRIALLEMGIFLTCMLLFILPWMLVNLEFAGTPFYPLLGHGLVTKNALGIASFSQFIDSILTFLPFFIILISITAILNRYKKSIDPYFLFFITSLTICTILATCALSMTTAGSITRYSYVSIFGPIAFLAAYVSFNLCVKGFISPSRHSISNLLIIVALIFSVTPQLLDVIKRGYRITTNKIYKTVASDKKQLDFYNDRLRISALQNSIPPDCTVLLRLDTPFLIDFRKHKYHVMDWPGNVGPAPGFPFNQSPEDLAQYLRNQGIRCVAYSYGNEALFSIKDSELSSRRNHPNLWVRTQALRTFDVQKQLENLGYQYVRIFDNGEDFVIDLSQKNTLNVLN
jgi:hypothetical protein